MPALVFVDSNVLVYAHDRADPSKQAKAREAIRKCWAEKSGCLSLQVLQEFYVNITRKVRHPLSLGVAREPAAHNFSVRSRLVLLEFDEKSLAPLHSTEY
jgi:predicted nucleic acid-binding protein